MFATKEIGMRHGILEMARPILLQGAFLGGLAFGARVLRNFVTIPLHPSVVARPDIACHTGIASTMTQLARLDNPLALESVMDSISRFLKEDRSDAPSAQWHMARMCTEIISDVKHMLSCANVTASDELFRVVLICSEEVIPQLETHLEDVLHNHLLRRAPRG
jgi:hypothetical protein